MKKILFFALTLVFAGFIQAQEKTLTETVSGTEVNANFEKYSQEMNLTEAQKSEILAIHEKYNKKKIAIRGTGTPEQFKALEEAKQKEIEAILNNDQKNLMERAKIQGEKDNKAKEFKQAKTK